MQAEGRQTLRPLALWRVTTNTNLVQPFQLRLAEAEAVISQLVLAALTTML